LREQAGRETKKPNVEVQIRNKLDERASWKRNEEAKCRSLNKEQAG
jgi:hypothetical protein